MVKIKPEIPEFKLQEFFPKKNEYCVCIPVINEGKRLLKQLGEMRILTKNIDILVLDAGSTDGSTDPDILKKHQVRALLTKTGPGKLGAQLRMGYFYALQQGYQGIITIDGNNKDNSSAIPLFMQKLDQGYDFVQGSRYIKGGKAVNTPFTRLIAMKLIHIPVISLLAGFKYTDTTNGYRGYSRKLLQDPGVNPFRNIFNTYELLAYLSVIAPKLKYRVTEVPVTRSYPKQGKTPTKISFLSGNLNLLKILLNLALGRYNVKND